MSKEMSTLRHHGSRPEIRHERKSLQLNWPWWLHPVIATLFLTALTTFFAVGFDEETYGIWNVPKYLDEYHSAVLLVGLLALAIGLMLPSVRTLSSGPTNLEFSAKQISFLKRSFQILFLLTILGYVFWIASAAAQGVGFTDLANVVDREARAISELKANSRPIAGLTTLTQFAPLAASVGLLLNRLGVQGNSYLWIVPLALVRTVFYAERLALIEVLIPLLVIFTVTSYKKTRWTWLLRLGPIVAAPVIWGVFAASEYMRSWIFYQDVVNVPFVEWVTTRLLGYYVTAYNNSALFAQVSPGLTTPPYFIIPAFWNAPGVETLFPHPGLNGLSPDNWWASTLISFANPEFTNVGSFLVVQGELGSIGMAVYWIVTGIILGILYSMLRRGSVLATLTYAIIYVGILELPRFIYWAQGRFFPLLIAIAVLMATYPRNSAISKESELKR